MRAFTSLLPLAVPVSMLLLGGCGGAVEVAEVASETSPPPGGSVPLVDPGPELTCGGLAFTAATLRAGGGEPGELRGPITDALEAHVREMTIDRPSGLPTAGVTADDWFLLAVDGEVGERAIEVATGSWDADGPGDDGATTRLEEQGDGALRVVGGGSCRTLEPVLVRGASWVEVFAPEEGLDRATHDITVVVSERQCAAARRPEPHLRAPEVTETDDAVTIAWTSDDVFDSLPAGVAVTCPGNPYVRRTVHLAEPLGDRVLLDGSRWPAREVRPVG